ncbi:MAG TPA: hypothetical protein VGD80_24695, partial [Kofleriaceae bacterium]
GNGDDGQLGNGARGGETLPVLALGDGRAIAVAAARKLSCALRADGSVACWGLGSSGQLGDGTLASWTPQPVLDLVAPTAVATGGFHSCAIADPNGSVYCWGANDDAQLGNLDGAPKARPVSANVSTAVQLALGVDHACARLRDGTVRCWGDGGDGQLGNGDTPSSSEPVQVNGLSGVSAIAAGEDFTCAVNTSGVFCWGYDGNGELGDAVAGSGGSPQPVPTQVPGITGATMIAAGHHHACAGNSLGLKCWGQGADGQLGDGGNTAISPPVPVDGAGSGAMWTPARLAAGADHTCAIDTARRLRCWGDNDSGELGDGSFHDHQVPAAVAIALTASVFDVSTGDDGTCAQTSDGPMCWGENYYGQVGDGGTVFQGAPVAVKLAGTTAFPMAGGGHACAVVSGQVLCWGDNADGQLGIGTFSVSLVPTSVVFP